MDNFKFIREHLTPRFSEVAKPLRDAVLDMQQKRAVSGRKSKSKYMPKPKPVAEDSPWPSFWSQECEDSFLALKRICIHSVELMVPDFQGAHNKTNVFHLWPDACKYGVGAGLFQGSKVPATGSANGDSENMSLCLSAYEILGVPTSSTKGHIDQKYQFLRKQLQARENTQDQLVRLYEAHQEISDVANRKEYDAKIGLLTSKKKRVDMRPLGFFSKSLSKAQQNWPTWERELLAVLLALVHFRSIVAGAYVEIHTDHLNNTVLNQALSNHDKILRMLLKIVCLVFVFLVCCQYLDNCICSNITISLFSLQIIVHLHFYHL